ncbi:MAG: hypothetical protein ACUVX1_05665 [Chloroflexota bacterium]
MVAQHLRKRYGDAVRVEYYDLGKDPDRGKFPDISKLIEEKDLPVPVVAIDGVPTMAGVVDFWAIVEAIDAKASSQPATGA